MLRHSIKAICLAGGLCLQASAGQVSNAEIADDPHLPIVPRTEAEAARIAKVLRPPTDFSAPEAFEDRPAGAATRFGYLNTHAFSSASANMPFERELDFKVGNGLFKKLWVSSPASTKASDGLGPLYNARSCQRCHLKDGRGHTPNGPEDNAVSLLLKIGLPGGEPGPIPGSHAVQPHPVYGGQLQDFSTAGVPAEHRLGVIWEEFEVQLSGGDVAVLRRPTWQANLIDGSTLSADTMLSPRIAPQMIGLGLLEAIPAADILANADPEDADGDGISGRPSIVWSREFDRPMLGRFGLKARKPTLRSQSAGAFSGDMGLSTTLFPEDWGDCTAAQNRCRGAPH
ncbi:MAG: di-heme oxidoredictase family protein, partial [Pseudomonadota bacterium]